MDSSSRFSDLWDKSSLSPSQVPTYLGAVLDCPYRLARPAGHRVSALQERIVCANQSLIPATSWQVLLGHVASMTDLIPDCRMWMRPLPFSSVG